MQLFADFIATTLARPCPPACHRYLVVDTAATRPLNFVRELALKDEAIDLLTREPCVWRDSASPVLFELPAEPASATTCRKTRELLNQWRYANCFLYVESPYSGDVAIRLFGERTNAVLPQNMPVVLRYFDSRIFGALMRALNDAQLRAFLSAGTRWALPGRSGELCLLEHGSDSQAPAFTAPLEFDTAQEAALIDAAEADAMVDLLLSQSSAGLLAMLPPEQHRSIVAALAVARTHGIHDVTDQAAFCSVSLELGLGFVSEPPWVSELPALQAGTLKFAQVLGRVARDEAR